MATFSQHDLRFGDRVSAVRRYRGMSQHDLANNAGLGRSGVAEIERHVRGVRIGEAVLICRALGVSLEQMIGDAPLVLAEETRIARIA